MTSLTWPHLLQTIIPQHRQMNFTLIRFADKFTASKHLVTLTNEILTPLQHTVTFTVLHKCV